MLLDDGRSNRIEGGFDGRTLKDGKESSSIAIINGRRPRIAASCGRMASQGEHLGSVLIRFQRLDFRSPAPEQTTRIPQIGIYIEVTKCLIIVRRRWLNEHCSGISA